VPTGVPRVQAPTTRPQPRPARAKGWLARPPAWITRAKIWITRAQATRPLRAWARLNDARGGVLAGGIAYFGFFSLVPALTVGFTVFGYVLGGDVALQRQVAQRVNTSVGFTLIGTRPGSGVVQLASLVQHGVLTVTGLFGLVVLVVAGLGWLDATREGIRAMFGLPVLADPVRARARDLAALALLGLAVLASLVAGVVVGTATGALGRALGWDGTPLADSAIWLTGTLVLLAVDMLIFLLFLTVLAGVAVPVGDLRSGAFLAAAGMQILKLSAGPLVQRVSHNPLLASSVVLVGLLVWMNLAARLTLLGAAWAAITAADRGHLGAPGGSGSPTPGTPGTMGTTSVQPSGRAAGAEAAMAEPRGGLGGQGPGRLERVQGRVVQGRGGRGWRRPGPVDRSRPSPYARRGTPPAPTFGQRSADRVTLAAGIVLGAGALIGLRLVRRAVGAVRDAARG